jgi:branched-chain amino acid transport system permease protein
MKFFVQQLVNGLSIGAQYSLWAVGYGLVYQVLGLMHFAHGDTLMFSAFVAYTLVAIGVPLWLVVILSMLVAALIAVIIEQTIYRPLISRGQTFLAFIGALAASLILRNIVTLVWGNGTKVFPNLINVGSVTVLGIRVSVLSLANLAIAIATVTTFQAFLNRTRHGQAILAVAQDRQMASVVGIADRKMVALVYALSGAIGMVGVILYVASFKALTISVGFRITLVAFVAAILGGIGRVKGAVIGGLLLGVAEAMIVGYISTVFLDAIVFALLMVFLIVRPYGIMGRKETVKL